MFNLDCVALPRTGCLHARSSKIWTVHRGQLRSYIHTTLKAPLFCETVFNMSLLLAFHFNGYFIL